MPGHFYAPPPTFIGGRQPFAPPLGLPQSGPVPMAPPLRGAVALATLGIIVSSWQPPFFEAQGAGDIAPIIGNVVAPSNPPVVNRINANIIAAGWQVDPTTVVHLTSIAPLLTTVVQPPVPSLVNQNIILSAWQLPPFPLIDTEQIAPLIPPAAQQSNPPYSKVSFNVAIAQWQSVPYAQPVRPFVASLPIVNTAPVPSLVNQNTILTSWVLPFVMPQGFAKMAPLIPAAVIPSQPPPLYGINNAIIYRSWDAPPWWQAQGAGDIAPDLPRVDNPPAYSLVNARTILEQWQPRWVGPSQVTIAPFIPSTVQSSALAVSNLALQIVIAQWQPSFFEAQGAGDIAPILQLPVVQSVPYIDRVTPIVIAQWQPPFFKVQGAAVSGSWLPSPPPPGPPNPAYPDHTIPLVSMHWNALSYQLQYRYLVGALNPQTPSTFGPSPGLLFIPLHDDIPVIDAPQKFAGETFVLGIDFSQLLPAGTLLSGSPVVSITESQLELPIVTPLTVFGSPVTDLTNTIALIPFTAGDPGMVYVIDIACPTTDPFTQPAIRIRMPVI